MRSATSPTTAGWRALPIDFPHPKLVYHYFTVWAAEGTLSRIDDTLREQVRVAECRQPVPTADLIDAQSLRAAMTRRLARYTNRPQTKAT